MSRQHETDKRDKRPRMSEKRFHELRNKTANKQGKTITK